MYEIDQHRIEDERFGGKASHNCPHEIIVTGADPCAFCGLTDPPICADCQRCVECEDGEEA